MKNGIACGLLLGLLCRFCCLCCVAEDFITEPLVKETVQQEKIKVKIPAGTTVRIAADKEIDADNNKEGDNVYFTLLNPIIIEDYEVVKSGLRVEGRVIDKHNNFIFGKPGNITLGDFKLELANGEFIDLHGELYDKGEARWWANIGWLIVWPLLFVKGDDGKISQGTSKILHTSRDFYVEVTPDYNWAI